MSANYFTEKFRQATGLNFVEYVARTRIEEARQSKPSFDTINIYKCLVDTDL